MATSGSPSLEPLIASSGSWGVPSLEVLTASGDASESLVGATGAVTFEVLTATGETVPVNVASGAGVLEKLDAVGGINPRGEAALERLNAVGVGRGPVSGAVTFEPLAARYQYGYPQFEPLRALGQASETVQSTYSAKVMNTHNGAVTEFTNYPFNSFAKVGKVWYAAGPGGLVKLTGTKDITTNIDWSFRTGQLDDGKIIKKRLPEVLAALRTNGKVKVKVWKDDSTAYEYDMRPIQKTGLRQQRAKIGRGMESRYFQVQLSGQAGADLELDSLQINMTETTRREG